MPSRARIAAVLEVLITVSPFASCAGARTTSTGSESSASDSPLITGAAGSLKAVDAEFARRLIGDQSWAVELTALAATRSTDPRVTQLAAAMSARLPAQIQTVTALLLQAGQDPHDAAAGTQAQGGVDTAAVTNLESLRGNEFDELWLHAMLGEEQAVLEAARTESATGTSTDAVALAGDVAAEAQSEIVQMKHLVDN
jgi:uncharacterized protein (DUF305 family)